MRELAQAAPLYSAAAFRVDRCASSRIAGSIAASRAAAASTIGVGEALVAELHALALAACRPAEVRWLIIRLSCSASAA